MKSVQVLGTLLQGNMTMQQVADKVGISRMTLHRKLKDAN
ncbi:helix-turn-helix domain-containing protein [Shimazuella alba]|uniref:Helix-turn-helix domain-containing protein n=1 Tax=Shimazuella alba TaxID=2690964 RepID=A0A6I4VW13_9BACL|nr:helix-turn-helix domain-containing protein [Shimazuella alba]